MADGSSAARRLRKHLMLAGVDRRELHQDVPASDESPGTRRADFHSFRRLMATALARAGVPVRDAMAVLGHKTASVYMRYVAEQEVQDVVDAALPQRPARTPGADTGGAR